MKRLVVLTGSGISSESGLKTFRDAGGLWEDHDVMEVASYDGWLRNRDLVLKFYNERRAQLSAALPNNAHKGLAELEKHFDVRIITQNVDNLHEKAGSSNVLHLHGILTGARCSEEPHLKYDIGYKPILPGDKCENGHQLRPDIVWFGEIVTTIGDAADIACTADIFVVIGTSLVVYPAAGLIHYVPDTCPVYVIDPDLPDIPGFRNAEFIKAKAGEGIEVLKGILANLR